MRSQLQPLSRAVRDGDLEVDIEGLPAGSAPQHHGACAELIARGSRRDATDEAAPSFERAPIFSREAILSRRHSAPTLDCATTSNQTLGRFTSGITLNSPVRNNSRLTSDQRKHSWFWRRSVCSFALIAGQLQASRSSAAHDPTGRQQISPRGPAALCRTIPLSALGNQFFSA